MGGRGPRMTGIINTGTIDLLAKQVAGDSIQWEMGVSDMKISHESSIITLGRFGLLLLC